MSYLSLWVACRVMIVGGVGVFFRYKYTTQFFLPKSLSRRSDTLHQIVWYLMVILLWLIPLDLHRTTHQPNTAPLILLIDRSWSMSYRRDNISRNAYARDLSIWLMQQWLQTWWPVGVVWFGEVVTLLLPLQHYKNSDTDILYTKINETLEQWTALWNGLVIGIDMIIKYGSKGGHVVVITDAGSNTGRYPSDIINPSNKSDIPISILQLGNLAVTIVDPLGNNIISQPDTSLMQAIAQATKGHHIIIDENKSIYIPQVIDRLIWLIEWKKQNPLQQYPLQRIRIMWMMWCGGVIFVTNRKFYRIETG